jgi:hypothetical protein
MNNATSEDYLRDEAQKDLNPCGVNAKYHSDCSYGIHYEPSTGCWIDDRWGHYAPARLIQIAVDLGWQDQDAAELADCYMDHKGMDADKAERTFWASEDAEDWLNENVAREGYMFGWSDGEFFLMPIEWWSEED